MSGRGLRGAASVAAALRRLDRLGHVPAALHGPGPLDGLTGRPPAALVAEGPEAVGEAALADALAQVEALRNGAPSADGPVTRAVAAHSPALPELRQAAVPPAVAGARVSRRIRAPRFVTDPASGRTHAAWPAAVEPPATGWNAPPLPSLPPRGAAAARGTAPPAPTPMPTLSRSARLGAATPVGLPAARVRFGAGPGPSFGPEPDVALVSLGFAPPGSASTSRAPAGSAATSRAPAVSRVRTATAAALDDSRGGPPHVEQEGEAGGERRDPARTGPAHALDLTQQPSPAPANGLTGLVSWWDAQTATRDAEGGVSDVPAVARPAVAWSAVEPRAHEGAATTGGAFEGSLAARLSLRSAIEDLLLAEARASGIEVRP